MDVYSNHTRHKQGQQDIQPPTNQPHSPYDSSVIRHLRNRSIKIIKPSRLKIEAELVRGSHDETPIASYEDTAKDRISSIDSMNTIVQLCNMSVTTPQTISKAVHFLQDNYEYLNSEHGCLLSVHISEGRIYKLDLRVGESQKSLVQLRKVLAYIGKNLPATRVYIWGFESCMMYSVVLECYAFTKTYQHEVRAHHLTLYAEAPFHQPLSELLQLWRPHLISLGDVNRVNYEQLHDSVAKPELVSSIGQINFYIHWLDGIFARALLYKFFLASGTKQYTCIHMQIRLCGLCPIAIWQKVEVWLIFSLEHLPPTSNTISILFDNTPDVDQLADQITRRFDRSGITIAKYDAHSVSVFIHLRKYSRKP